MKIFSKIFWVKYSDCGLHVLCLADHDIELTAGVAARQGSFLFWTVDFSMWLCLCFLPREQFFSYLAAVTITGDEVANLDLSLALMAFSSKGSFTCHTYCDTQHWFIRSHPKDRYPRPTMGFEPAMQGSSDLCTAALTTALRGRLDYFLLMIRITGIKDTSTVC
jgi:hypothetical protein